MIGFLKKIGSSIKRWNDKRQQALFDRSVYAENLRYNPEGKQVRGRTAITLFYALPNQHSKIVRCLRNVLGDDKVEPGYDLGYSSDKLIWVDAGGEEVLKILTEGDCLLDCIYSIGNVYRR